MEDMRAHLGHTVVYHQCNQESLYSLCTLDIKGSLWIENNRGPRTDPWGTSQPHKGRVCWTHEKQNTFYFSGQIHQLKKYVNLCLKSKRYCFKAYYIFLNLPTLSLLTLLLGYIARSTLTEGLGLTTQKRCTHASWLTSCSCCLGVIVITRSWLIISVHINIWVKITWRKHNKRASQKSGDLM